NTVEIDHGFGYVTRYGHASKLLVRRGQEIRRGEVIAHVGSTGISTSSHLHYEVHVGGVPVNPMNYVIRRVLP
ncbi:MAG: M23 family metallopeptidase, partial [Gemmatimonadetes bacterium]|nr:M23 family metallopeptidase [Gemmatimonadota bacterium]